MVAQGSRKVQGYTVPHQVSWSDMGSMEHRVELSSASSESLL